MQDPGRRLASARTWLDTLLVILLVAVSASMLWRLWGGSTNTAKRAPSRTAPTALPLPTEPIAIDDSASRGSGPVALIVFSDFQCPYCKTFATTTWAEIDRTYIATGKVTAVFKHLPLEAIHKDAKFAAEVAECARRQGKFWTVHDQMFAPNFRLSRAGAADVARKSGLDNKSLSQCLATDAGSTIEKDVSQARGLRVTGTPTFLIGRLNSGGQVAVSSRLSGAAPFDRFKVALESALSSIR